MAIVDLCSCCQSYPCRWVTAANVPLTESPLHADAARWRFFAEHAFDSIEGKRLGDWLPDAAWTHGSLTKALDHAMQLYRAASQSSGS